MSSSAPLISNFPRATSRGPLPQKRHLSDSETTNETDTKRVKKPSTEQQNAENSKPRDSRDKKKRRRKKRKTSVVVVDATASRVVKSPTVASPRSSSNVASSSTISGRASSSTLSNSKLSPHVQSACLPTAGPSTTRPEIDHREDGLHKLSVSV